MSRFMISLSLKSAPFYSHSWFFFTAQISAVLFTSSSSNQCRSIHIPCHLQGSNQRHSIHIPGFFRAQISAVLFTSSNQCRSIHIPCHLQSSNQCRSIHNSSCLQGSNQCRSIHIPCHLHQILYSFIVFVYKDILIHACCLRQFFVMVSVCVRLNCAK